MVSKKRILTMLMAIVMVLSMLPMQVLATEAAEATNNEVSVIATETTVSLLDEAVSFTLSGYGSSKSDDTYLEYKYNNSGAAYTDQITVTNNTGTDAYPERMQFSFQVYASVTDVSVGNDPVVLLPGQSITITYKVPDGSKYISLEEFALTPIVSKDVQFVYDSSLGKVAVGGTDVESGYTREIPGLGISVTAKPNEGVTFLGWVDQSGKIIPGSETITLNPTDGLTTVRPAFATANSKAWFKTTGYLFDSLRAANDHIKSIGGTITLAADGVLNENAEISENVTLFIPYAANRTIPNERNKPTQSANDVLKHVSESKAFRTLVLAENVELDIKGDLYVDGSVFSSGARDTTTPHGNYGMIVLQNNSELTIGAGANAYVYGYIVGTYTNGVYTGGTVIAESTATVYELFQARDVRGRDVSEMADDYDTFPITQYYVQNIEAKYEIGSGALSKAIMRASGSGMNPIAEFPFVGTDNGLFRISSGKVIRLYDPYADRVTYTTLGNVILDSIQVTIATEHLNSAEFYMAVNGNISVDVQSGKLTVLNKFKMLPGSEIHVADGADLEVAKTSGQLILFDRDHWVTAFSYYPATTNEFVDGWLNDITFNNEGTVASVVRYSPTRELVKGGPVDPKHGSAKLVVDGDLIAYGNVFSTSKYTNPDGNDTVGTAYDNVLSGTGTFVNTGAYSSVTLDEFWGNNKSKIASISTTALLGNVVGGEFPAPFTNTNGTTYYGYFHESNNNGTIESVDYIWSTEVLTETKLVKLAHGGKVLAEWEDTVYPGMDYSKYFSDIQCKIPATEADEILYVTGEGEACIENSNGIKFYDNLETAVNEAKPGDTVTLLKDVVYEDTGIFVTPDIVDITLNLNNHSVTAGAYALLNRGRISIYGGDLKDAQGNDLPAGKLITNNTSSLASALYNQGINGEEVYVGEIISIGGNLELIAKDITGEAAVFNKDGYIGQFGTEGSVIKVTGPKIVLYNTVDATIDVLGGAGSHVEITQNTGENVNLYAVLNHGIINLIGDENATVKITQNYEVSVNPGNKNPYVIYNDGTIGAIAAPTEDHPNGGKNATVLLHQTAASGYGFGLANYGAAKVGTIGGPVANRVEVVAAHIPVYVSEKASIEEIGANTLFVAKAHFTTQSAIWNIGSIKKISGGYFNSATNTLKAIFYTGANASGVDTLNAVPSGYGMSSTASATVKSLCNDQSYTCYEITAAPVGVARIGSVYYPTLVAAVNAAKAGETVTLLSDVTGQLIVNSDRNIILDLNNHSITYGGHTLLNRGTLTIHGGAFEDANGNKLEPGKLITTGGATTSSALYNQKSTSDNYVGTINALTGNLKLEGQNLARGLWIDNGYIGQIGTEGSKIQITSNNEAIYMSGTAEIAALGGAGSEVEIIQTPDTDHTPYLLYMKAGTIDKIGDTGATVKMTLTSKSNKQLTAVIKIDGKATINNIGTAIGSKVLMHQNKVANKSGWAIDVRSGGTIGTIGSANSLVEVVTTDYYAYCNGGSIGTVTGNSYFVSLINDKKAAFDGPTAIGSITGGYYSRTNNNPPFGDSETATADNMSVIENAGYMLSNETVSYKSEITKETYDFRYVFAAHDHAFNQEPVVEWVNVDGNKVLRASIECAFDGCSKKLTAESVANVEYVNTDDGYVVTYSATVIINDKEYTLEPIVESLTLAGKKTMQYDDRIPANEIRIIDKGTPSSYKVGQPGVLDDAVVMAADGKLIASGIGTALVYMDGGVYEITVEKAIIDMFMITGHSLGMGSQGNTQQSVLIEEGKAYSFTGTNRVNGGNDYTAKIGESDGVGLGYAAEKRPPEVDDFTASGAICGVQGEDSALAWKWNQMTGHKVYVVNNAVGSTSMAHWINNTSNSSDNIPILDNAIDNFTAARNIIQNEVAAGHFDAGNMVLINHTAANYSSGHYKYAYNHEDGEAWVEQLFGAMRTALNKDWDGDGTVEANETISIGYVPIWTVSGNLAFSGEKSASVYLGVSDQYPDMFVASLLGREWSSDEKVQAYFANYVTPENLKLHNGTDPVYPTTQVGVYADNVHYIQVVYNVIGMDIAENIYEYLVQPAAAEDVSVKLLNENGTIEYAVDGTEELDLDFSDRLTLVPLVDPISVNDLTIEASGCLAIQYPLTVYAAGGGEGSLTISYKGTPLKTLTVDMGEAIPAAKVGEKEYLDIHQAISEAPENGTVVLLRDIELSGSIKIAADKKITLDLNNHSISSEDPLIINYGTLNIYGGALKDADGNAMEPGKLLNTHAVDSTSKNICVENRGTIGTIGGNLYISCAAGFGAAVFNYGEIGTIGGKDSDVVFDTKNMGIYVVEGGHVGYIGGECGKVSITAAQYPVRANGGSIDVIGGKNSSVALCGITWTTVVVDANSSIGLIGGRDANVTISPKTSISVATENSIGDICNVPGVEAQIGKTYYAALNTAVSAVQPGQTLKVLSDVEFTGTADAFFFDQTKTDVTLNLNNHSVTAGGYALLNRGRISIYGGDLKDAQGNDLPAGKLITNNQTSNSSALYNQQNDGKNNFIGEIVSVGGNLELIANGITGKAAVFNQYGHIGTFGTEGSVIKVTGPNIVLYNTVDATIDVLGGAGSYVEMTQNTGENVNLYEVLNHGTINLIGDENATVKITQNYEVSVNTGTNNPYVIYNQGTIGAIAAPTEAYPNGGKNATVLLHQTAASGLGFGLANYSGGKVGTIGGPVANRVEVVAAHIPVYVAEKASIEEIGANTLFVAKAHFTSQSAIWNAGSINKISGGYFNSATNTIKAIFYTGANASGIDTLKSMAPGYGISTVASASVTSLCNNKSYTCYEVTTTPAGVARIGSVYYPTLVAAVNAAKAGETVTLLSDVTGQLIVNGDRDIILDLNNHSITYGGHTLVNRGTLTIHGGAFEDANGNKLEPGKLITTGGATTSSALYNQKSTSDNWVGTINALTGNLKLEGQNLARGLWIDNGYIGQIGTDGSKIQITSNNEAIYMTGTAEIAALGGAGSEVEIIQTPDTDHTPYLLYMKAGTIDKIGDTGATVKMTLTSKSSKELTAVIKINGKGTINNIGTAIGSKVLMHQNKVANKSGWAIDVRSGGTIGTIGSANSLVEVVTTDYYAYCNGGSIGTVTGNTYFVSLINDTKAAFDGPTAIGSITGGYYSRTNNNPPFGNSETATADNMSVIENAGYALSTNTVSYKSEITNKTYDFRYVHKHSFGDVVYSGDGKTAYTAAHSCACGFEETAIADITEKVVKAATCIATGEMTYTAVFTEGWAVNKVTTEDIPVISHKFGGEWLYNAEGHWQLCEYDCNTASEAAGHMNESGQDHLCDVCKFVMSTCADSEKTTSYARVEGTETHTVTVTCDVCQQQVGEITTVDCADANGDSKCDLCEGAIAPKGYNVKFVNYTAGGNAAVVSIGDEAVEYRQKEAVDAVLGADGVFTVASAQQCLVLISTEEDVYTEVKATSNADGVYNFTITEPTEGMTIVVIFKGDVNEDGYLTAADAALILRAVAELDTLSNLQKIVAEVNADTYITAADAAKILRVVAELDPGF